MFRRQDDLLSAVCGPSTSFRGFASDCIPVSWLEILGVVVLCSCYFPPRISSEKKFQVFWRRRMFVSIISFLPFSCVENDGTLRDRNSDTIIILSVSPQSPLTLLTCNVRSYSSSRYVRRLESPLPHAV